MRGFNAKELGYKGVEPSANDAIAEANYMYSKMYREETNAARPIPVVDLPYDEDMPEEMKADLRYSVESGEACIREANKRNFSLSAIGRANYDRIFRRH